VVHQNALDASRLAQVADQIALAVATFDQQGCVSPHAVFLIGSHTAARTLAAQVAFALDRLEQRLPRGRISTAEALAIHEARTRAEFRHTEQEPVIFAGRNTSYTVVLDGSDSFEPSCLNRFVYIKPVPNLEQLIQCLQPTSPYLQSVAVLGFPDHELPELLDRLARAGASRITTFAELPWPPADWHHDGSHPLRELIRWVDIET
jgi:hypothetical protein